MPETLIRSRTARLCARARAGFTLIEILAVILIIGILMAFLLPKIPEAIDHAKVTACKKNLQTIYEGLTLYNDQYKRVPEESGVRFFAALIYRGTWENTKTSAQKLTCPGVDIGSLALGGIQNPEEWYMNKDQIDGSYSSYAGPDLKASPLRHWPPSGKQALVADDNDGPENNHRTTTNVLYGDGSVGTFELFKLQEEGVIDKSIKVLKVGPDSPVEDLRKLSLN